MPPEDTPQPQQQQTNPMDLLMGGDQPMIEKKEEQKHNNMEWSSMQNLSE